MTRDPYASLKQGLVGCWIPSVFGSGLLLPDLSGRGNNGSLVGMDASDWVSGQYGRALDFDGSDDRVDTFNISSLCPNEVSVSWWQSPRNPFNSIYDGTTTLNRAAFTQGVSPPAFGIMHFSNNNIFAGFENSSGDFRVVVANSAAIWSQNTWAHWTLTAKNGGLTSLYVNGSLLGTTSGTVFAYPASVLSIAGNGRPFSGQLDDIRIYNRALSDSEIKLLASRPGIGLRQDRDRNTFYQFLSGARRKRILTGMP